MSAGDNQHVWQPRDDLSASSSGGGYWRFRTYECSACGALRCAVTDDGVNYQPIGPTPTATCPDANVRVG